MKIHGAVVDEQGVKFAIVIVKEHVMQTAAEAASTRAAYQPCFAGVPLVLASQNARGEFEYQGRRDLVDFLASIDSDRIPWAEYEVTGGLGF